MNKKVLAGLIVGGLAAWYAVTGRILPQRVENKYSIPSEIAVVQSSLPTEVKENKFIVTDSEGNKKEETRLEKIVKTEYVDFSKDFEIKTDRYTLVKDKDFLPFRLIGHVMCIPVKIILMDWDIGWGNDTERTKAILSMLETDKSIKDVTVRINHNKALYDAYRLFTDKKVIERNPFIPRATLGVLNCLKYELWAELGRGDYYNPMTQTVVVYSNIESIAAHEIGHHKDFQRFGSDWLYSLSRIIPPVTLYQEWKASTNARKIISPYDDYQFYRYLIPAFMTYVVAIGLKTARKIKKYTDEYS